MIRPPGQLRPSQVGSLVLGGQRQQERGPLPSGGQAQLSSGQDGERLVLPGHRLVDLGVMRILGLDASHLCQFLLAEFDSGGDVGGEFLAEGLYTLAVQGILPTLGRLLQICRVEPHPIGAGVGMQVRQIRPQPSRFRSQRLAVSERSLGQPTQ